jgi:hypothetical protein
MPEIKLLLIKGEHQSTRRQSYDRELQRQRCKFLQRHG